ncbi:HAD family hydrolase [Vibrio ostreicida]|uniref:HAD-IA family hydrolase n=1 Tax=Vibrio ostreicida TaxID=526588 RepID=A0ABT8BYC8_9VIBR|nr:HAD-IA family hydrolase [Vibrio ostreicida]MDN3611694.1 HAD-IA family hydrolase [Vibrio ostreicida]NPD10110.1 HAD-IA family hydrolase [Vibrio ostreicida]
MSGLDTQCVIFDCDGTLVDSEQLCCKALCDVFNRFDVHLSIEMAMEHFEGGKLADILTSMKQRLGLKASLDELEPMYREVLEGLLTAHLQPMDGVFELIDYLKAKEIEYCVASNGPKEKIERSLELTGLLPYFSGRIFSAFDNNSWKPEPDLVQYCAMHMGFSPQQCLYVDDTPKGLEAGLRAGIKTVQLIGLNRTLYSNKVHKISNLRELTALV